MAAALGHFGQGMPPIQSTLLTGSSIDFTLPALHRATTNLLVESMARQFWVSELARDTLTTPPTSRHLRTIAISFGQWPSPTTQCGPHRCRTTRQSRSAMRAAASASRRSSVIAIGSGRWQPPTPQPGSRQHHGTRLRFGKRAVASASGRLRAKAIRSDQWLSGMTRPGSRQRRGTRRSRPGIREAATTCRRSRAIAVGPKSVTL